MPQDIPIEASETLAFTPDSLKELAAPPVFTLRAATWREKRSVRKITDREGIEFHGTSALRAQARVGLEKQWGSDKFAEFMPRIEAWWDANDALEQERKADPEAVLEFDAEEAVAVSALLDKIEKMHRPLASMIADNSDYLEMRYPVLVTVTVTGWTGLKTKVQKEEGYLTLACAMALVEELDAVAREAGLQIPQVPFLQLGSACHDRLYLSDEERKNSASPSPSETPPEVSTTALTVPGPSPESTAPTASRKSSPKTPPKG